MSESVLRTKSYEFAIRMVHLSNHLATKREFVISKQVLRSGTSIGANVEEANQGESRKDFVHKLSIALKEAAETSYWLRLLRDGKTLDEVLANSLIDDCQQIQRILTASIRTSKSRGF